MSCIATASDLPMHCVPCNSKRSHAGDHSLENKVRLHLLILYKLLNGPLRPLEAYTVTAVPVSLPHDRDRAHVCRPCQAPRGHEHAPSLPLQRCQHVPCDVNCTCRGPVLKARKRLGAPPPGLAGGEALGIPTGCCTSGLAGGETLGGSTFGAPARPRRAGLDTGEALGGMGS